MTDELDIQLAGHLAFYVTDITDIHTPERIYIRPDTGYTEGQISGIGKHLLPEIYFHVIIHLFISTIYT